MQRSDKGSQETPREYYQTQQKAGVDKKTGNGEPNVPPEGKAAKRSRKHEGTRPADAPIKTKAHSLRGLNRKRGKPSQTQQINFKEKGQKKKLVETQEVGAHQGRKQREGVRGEVHQGYE